MDLSGEGLQQDYPEKFSSHAAVRLPPAVLSHSCWGSHAHVGAPQNLCPKGEVAP